jgi:AraC-like DNA-binding protein
MESIAEPSWSTHTTVLDEALEICDSALYPGQILRILENPDRFSMQQRSSRIGPITMVDLTFGTEIQLDCTVSSRSTYHVNLQLGGRVVVEHRGRELIMEPGRAAVQQVEGKTALTHWNAGSRLLSVKIERAAVDKALSDLLGHEIGTPIAFEPGLDTTNGHGRSWEVLVSTINDQIGEGNDLALQPLVADPLADSLLRGLLLSADHPYRDALMAPAPVPRPSAVRTAIDIIESEPLCPLTTSSLAARCHVSVRALQEGFQRYVGIPPTSYLRNVRMRHAHDELRAADPSVSTVASIAVRWGFHHLGRFAAAYRAKYGEHPGATLRKTR